MELEGRNTDDFLRRLITKIPLDQPSDSFVDKVMAGILPEAETVKSRRPFFLTVRSAIPWVLLVAFFVLFIASSDIPYFSSIPGKDYLHDTLWPALSSFFSGFLKIIPDGSSTSVALPILIAGLLLFGLERILSRRFESKHRTY